MDLPNWEGSSPQDLKRINFLGFSNEQDIMCGKTMRYLKNVLLRGLMKVK